MTRRERAYGALGDYVRDFNARVREVKIYLAKLDDELIAVHLRTNGFVFKEKTPEEWDYLIQEWSHSTMRLIAVDLRIGFMDIAVASNRNNYSPDLVTYTLRNLLERWPA